MQTNNDIFPAVQIANEKLGCLHLDQFPTYDYMVDRMAQDLDNEFVDCPVCVGLESECTTCRGFGWLEIL